jgi:large subunit ribosomal protein L22
MEAKKILAFDKTKSAKMLLKVVKSAEANAVNNNNLDLDKLYISDIHVNPGRIQRSGRAGSKGRYDPLRKRHSHIIVGLSVRGTKKVEKITKKKKTKVKKEDK